MTSAVVMAERCHYCSKQRTPRDMVRFGVAVMCQKCWENHQEAIHALTTGTPPKACQECNTPFMDLAEEPGGKFGDVGMILAHKDGIYQLLCRPCADRYAVKRPDLYGHGAFGRKMGLN